MNKYTVKKLATAVLTAACVLGVGVAGAVPKVSISLTAPKSTAGADGGATKFYKGLPWLPCTGSVDTEFGLVAKNKLTALKDQLVVDISATNEDVGKDGTQDYDLYVAFINYGSGLNNNAFAYYYFVSQTTSLLTAGMSLAPYTSSLVVVDDGNPATNPPAVPAAFLPGNKFSSSAYKVSIFNPLSADDFSLRQGMWAAMAIMVQSPVAPATITAATLQDPRKWEAWAVQPFIVGTPFATSTGVGNGAASGDGICK